MILNNLWHLWRIIKLDCIFEAYQFIFVSAENNHFEITI